MVSLDLLFLTNAVLATRQETVAYLPTNNLFLLSNENFRNENKTLTTAILCRKEESVSLAQSGSARKKMPKVIKFLDEQTNKRPHTRLVVSNHFIKNMIVLSVRNKKK